MGGEGCEYGEPTDGMGCSMGMMECPYTRL